MRYICGFVNFNLFHVIKFKLNLLALNRGNQFTSMPLNYDCRILGELYRAEANECCCLMVIHNENCN